MVDVRRRLQLGLQNFAALGYAVLYTNPRGSTGYGQDFVNGSSFVPRQGLRRPDAGVDAALARGFIDEKTCSCAAAAARRSEAWIWATPTALRPPSDAPGHQLAFVCRQR